MNPLTPTDFELECDLARWEAADDEQRERDWDDSHREYMSEMEAVEIAENAQVRPFSE